MTLDAIISNVKYSAGILLASGSLFGQSLPVSGRVLDGSSLKPLEGVVVDVHTSYNSSDNRVESGLTGVDGRFSVFASLTDVEREGDLLPDEYSLSTPFPNPSSGVSSVEFAVPKYSSLSLKVFNVLGEECFSDKFDVSSGVWRSGFDLSRYASGVYVVRLSSDDVVKSSKFVVDKRVLSSNISSVLSKVSDYSPLCKGVDGSRYVDSLAFSGPDYRRNVLRDIGYLDDGGVAVGDVLMISGIVDLDLFVYDLFNWREKDSFGIPGAVVRVGSDSVLTDASGRARISLPASGSPRDVRITSPLIRTRETKIVVDDFKSEDFDVMTFESYPDSIYNFMTTNFGVNGGFRDPLPFLSARWLNQPEFVFKADTALPSPNDSIASWMQLIDYNLSKIDDYMVPFSENPVNPEGFLKDYKWTIDKDAWYYNIDNGLHNNGKYIVEWDDSLIIKYSILAGTSVYLNYVSGEIYAANTVYDSFRLSPDGIPFWLNMDMAIIHEYDTGIYKTGRYNDIASVTNSALPYESRNYHPNDLPIRLYLLARPPGTVAPDKDDGWFNYPQGLNKASNSMDHLMAQYTFTMQDGTTRTYQEKISSLKDFKSIKELSSTKIKEMIRDAKVYK